MLDLSKLCDELRAGLDGTTCGEWRVDGFELGSVVARESGKTHVFDWKSVASCPSENRRRRADADHIARCSPMNISALLDERDMLREVLKAALHINAIAPRTKLDGRVVINHHDWEAFITLVRSLRKV